MGIHKPSSEDLSPFLEGYVVFGGIYCYARNLSHLKTVPTQLCSTWHFNVALVFLLVSVYCDTAQSQGGVGSFLIRVAASHLQGTLVTDSCLTAGGSHHSPPEYIYIKSIPAAASPTLLTVLNPSTSQNILAKAHF